jgi:hypothetical protein
VTWERLYLRLPSILKIVAENQRGPLQYLKGMGMIDLYASQKELIEKLRVSFSEGVKAPPDIVANGVSEICEVVLAS